MLKTKNVIVQVGSLFVVQWLSIVVIILNASALNASKDSNQGLIMASEMGPQDFILLIMAAISLFAVSLLLCLYLQLFFRLLGNHPISLSKSVLYVEIAFSLIIIFFWMAATTIVLQRFNTSSFCRHPPNISTLTDKIMFDDNRELVSQSACNLMNSTFILAYITIGVWLIPLFASIYSLLFDPNYQNNSATHPYQNVKLQVSRSISSNQYHEQQQYQRDPVQGNDNLHFSTMTTIKSEGSHNQKVFVISCPKDTPEKNKEINSTTPINDNAINPLPLQQQRSCNNMQQQQQQLQPQEPTPAILTNRKQFDWTFDFNFEPVNIDLMLPSSNELINHHDRKRFYYN